MKMAFIMGSVVLWLLGILVSRTIEAQYIGSDTYNVMSGMMTPQFANYNNPLAAIGGYFVLAWEWLVLFIRTLLWDYSFLTGYWMVLRAFGWAISFAFVISMVLALRGTSSN